MYESFRYSPGRVDWTSAIGTVLPFLTVGTDITFRGAFRKRGCTRLSMGTTFRVGQLVTEDSFIGGFETTALVAEHAWQSEKARRVSTVAQVGW